MPAVSRHTVQPRDTLHAIARANNTTADALARLNGLANPDAIRVGQVLRLHPDAFEAGGAGTVRDATPHTTAAMAGSAQVLAAAEARARDHGARYATDAHATSPNPAFPASGTPAGYWKCNMFAGDVLFDAGFEAPRYPSGWYALSQDWPDATHLFHEVPRDEARAGDVLILDRGATTDAEGGGHALILTGRIAADGAYGCIAVKGDGARPHTRNLQSDTAGRDDNGVPFRTVVLRPTQRRHAQLPGTTIVDPAKVRAPDVDLKRGATGDDVKQLQQCLVKLKFLSDAAMATGPGNFGDKTHAALAAFQRDKGVPVEPGSEGVYGPKTRAALIAALAS